MKLSDVIEEIDTFDEESTIFVESGRKISGRSESEVIYLSDEELAEDIAIVAEKRCKGKSYFLEVSIVIELKEGWADNHKGISPTNEQLVGCAIHYAEFDSYPSEFFN